MKPVNVLYLIRTWAFGGSHTIILLLLKHLPKDRFNITVIPYETPSGTDRQFIDAARKEGHFIPDDRIPWDGRMDWFAARRKIGELIEKYKVDLIHAHDTNSIVLVGVRRKRWPCACVASPYGWWETWYRFRARANHWVERNLALPNFDRVITVSNDMKTKILRGRTKEDKIRVIHTGLDLTRFDSGGSRPEVRRKLGIPDEAIVAGTVSRLFPEKGHRYLLDAVKILANEIPTLRLLIVGTGDLMRPLENYASELGLRSRVTFTGFYDDLPGALRGMDIFVQPSVQEEGFPTAILEAQLAKRPVIASDIGGARETFDAGNAGLLVPPKNVNALADALRALAKDPERCVRMGERGRAFVEQRFTLSAMTAKVTETYIEALDEYNRRQ